MCDVRRLCRMQKLSDAAVSLLSPLSGLDAPSNHTQGGARNASLALG
jgi:hypothetical protein